MKAARIHAWYLVHKWTSLVCTAFLLVICATGLPLCFGEEIDHWLDPTVYDAAPPGAPNVSLDRLTDASRRLYPGEVVTDVFIDDDEPQVIVSMAPSWAAIEADRRAAHVIRFDAHSGRIIEQLKPSAERPLTFMDLMLRLHVDLFARLPGELFLGFMGLLFTVAIVSGVVLYGPFMKKLDFGTVRRDRSTRLHWLDLHNLLGIVTLAWAFVVGATGVMNELSTPLFALWQRTDVQAVLAPLKGSAVPDNAGLSPVQAALETAQAAAPGAVFTDITFPGDPDASPYHYLIWGHGRSTLTSRLFTPVLVDARSGALAMVVAMPWYLRALEVSRPLHFGDYGGLPLKILWAVLDVITIVVLGSGLYLWIARRRHQAARLARIVAAHEAVALPEGRP